MKEVCEGLRLRKEKLEEQLLAIVGMVLPQFDSATAVRNPLSQFSPQEIKEKVEEGAADYLRWIEIWGGVLGEWWDYSWEQFYEYTQIHLLREYEKMTRKDAPENKPTPKEARKRKWLKRLRSIAVVSGAVLLLRGRKKPY